MFQIGFWYLQTVCQVDNRRDAGYKKQSGQASAHVQTFLRLGGVFLGVKSRSVVLGTNE